MRQSYRYPDGEATHRLLPRTGKGSLKEYVCLYSPEFYSPGLLIQNLKLAKIGINEVSLHPLVNRNYA